MASSRSFVIHLVCNVVLLIAALSPSLLLYLFVQPVHRGFACGDLSLSYPFRPEVLPFYAVIIIAIVLPVCVIFIVEVRNPGTTAKKRYVVCRSDGGFKLQPMASNDALSLAQRLAKYVTALLVSVAFAGLFTDIIAYYTGYQTPYFLDVCRPDVASQNCSFPNYVETYHCNQPDADLVKRARLSFPSGHASIAMSSMVYLVIYIHLRIGNDHQWIMVQSAFYVFLLATGLSCGCLSTMNHAHHLEDVLFGFALGAAVPLAIKSSLL